MASNPILNKTSKEWKACYEAFGYRMVNQNGDDEIWRKGDCSQVVYAPAKDSKVIIDGTAYHTIRHMEQCGISRKKIREWFEKLRNKKI